MEVEEKVACGALAVRWALGICRSFSDFADVSRVCNFLTASVVLGVVYDLGWKVRTSLPCEHIC